ncbi:MAG: riboflavin biosynthesis protein RibF, partial [Prevotella sp.]|nr:riboflavin biosynthesis protein RibF [Prevotella sp.]
MKRCIATIGFFDGVHKGHLCLIEQLQKNSRALGLDSL